mgnify:FL=1
MISLIGMGSGCPESLTAQGLAALQSAGLILGAKRLLEHLPAGCTDNCKAVYKPEEILACLTAQPDTGHRCFVQRRHRVLLRCGKAAALLRAMGYSVRVLPGLSSVQLLAAAVGRPWQDWKLVSAHGRACDPVAEVLAHPQVFFLTGGGDTPASLCAKLTAAGLGAAHALVGENLGTPAEAIRFGLARELAEQSFAPLSVLLIEREALPSRRTPGLPDDAFIRGAVPMTKQEVRAAALAKLAVTPTDTLWDVGAGTGSVSVELALAAPAGQVYAVECDPKACILIQKNREKFAAYNLTLIEGKAPEALDTLPAPDAVFIGGTKGNMDAVIDAVLHKNSVARLCVAAIALETLSAAVAALTAHGLSVEVTQIAVNRTKTAGSLHLLMANNPVFLITGART